MFPCLGSIEEKYWLLAYERQFEILGTIRLRIVCWELNSVLLKKLLNKIYNLAIMFWQFLLAVDEVYD